MDRHASVTQIGQTDDGRMDRRLKNGRRPGGLPSAEVGSARDSYHRPLLQLFGVLSHESELFLLLSE